MCASNIEASAQCVRDMVVTSFCGGILALTLGFEPVTVSGKGEAIRVQRRRWTNFGVMGREGKGRERPMRRYRGMIFAFGPMFS